MDAHGPSLDRFQPGLAPGFFSTITGNLPVQALSLGVHERPGSFLLLVQSLSY